jgi:hypothetical protein
MTEEQKDQQGVPESLADESTREKLAKARKRTRASLARKLKVSKETVRRSERRADLYLSILREYVERKGGNLWLKVKFPDRPPVILARLGENTDEKRTKNRRKTTAKSKPKPKSVTRRAS